MATTEIAPTGSATSAERKPIVNDFSIQVATANGSGSQSANTVLLRSIFQMGVPVSGKNLFPSNIAGLPTWYTIRASKKGYIARKKEIDDLVAQYVYRVLAQMGLPQEQAYRWEGQGKGKAREA